MCGSSGEIVVLAFKNKTNSRSFGEPTYGLSSGNTEFKLSDGAVIYLTTHLDIDRQLNVYGGKIMPDHTVADSAETKNDEVIDAAMSWLSGR